MKTYRLFFALAKFFKTKKLKFHPDFDYRSSNLDENDKTVLYFFEELIKNLFEISSPAEKQHKMRTICDELANDFDFFFNNQSQNFLTKGLITLKQQEQLKDLDKFFDERSGDKNPEFWDEHFLATNSDWAIARQKAKNILASLGFQGWTIEREIEDQKYRTPDGKYHTSGYSLRTWLVRKQS